MRNLSCALVRADSTDQMIARARSQSRVTHGHPISQMCCALSALVSAQLLRGVAPVPALDLAMRQVKESIPTMEDQMAMKAIVDAASSTPTGTSYVVDCFWSAWHALTHSHTFEGCVKTAILLGNDTDTTACVAGGWAGALYGFEGIPQRWIDRLQPCPDHDRLRAVMLVASMLDA